MILNKEQILAADDLPREQVSVPEWGGELYVRVMTGAQRDQMEYEVITKKSKNVRATIAALTICDESGQPLFTPDDVEKLGQKSSAALDRVFSAAQRLNKLRPGDIEDLEKN